MEHSDETWAEPAWQPYRKHLPPGESIKKWSHLVKETTERGHKGYYCQDLDRRLIEHLEMLTVTDGALLLQHGPVRYYWHEHDRVIGASRGEETRFLLAEHHQSGPVHGHPVTWRELEQKGARR